MQNKPIWLQVAEKEIGTHEVDGEGNNLRILEYHKCTTLHADKDSVPWCSAFVNWCIRKAGLIGTNSAAARSWLQWGRQLFNPAPGCIVILKRGAPPSGHVTFYVKDRDKDFITCLGGNQGDQVKYSHYRKSDILGYRWPLDV